MLLSTVTSQDKKLPEFNNGNNAMERVLIIAEDAETMDTLRREIARVGYDCSVVSCDDVQKIIERQAPQLIIVDSSRRFDARVWEFIVSIKKQKKLPIIVLIASENLNSLDDYREIDDFILYPWDDTELLLRIKRLLHKTSDAENSEQIKCDGLTIDLVTCEVTADGKKADLTYKEYELLKLMASNRGRVFTREALLDKIWGYDYYGGDRTVDVHMRRLRSKIEDANHTYIETVRNIGYRFIKSS